MQDETKRKIESEINAYKLSNELLTEYKNLISNLNNKVVNKNITEIRTENARFYLSKNNWNYEISIIPLNSQGYSYIDFYQSKRTMEHFADNKKYNIFQILDGRKKETLNLEELNRFIDDFIKYNNEKIEYYTKITDEYIAEYMEKMDKFIQLREELNAYGYILGKSTRQFLYDSGERTPNGEILSEYSTSIN